MINEFKLWFNEIQESVIEQKKSKARSKGDESKWKKEIWSSPEKNKMIKSRFRDEGEIRGYRSRPSYKTNAGEWLYDFVWREFDQNQRLKRVVLAMEVEVSDKYIIYDFNKLLQADAEYKVMVFQLKYLEDIENMFITLKAAIATYQSKVVSHFLLVGWCTSENTFKYADIYVDQNFKIT